MKLVFGQDYSGHTVKELAKHHAKLWKIRMACENPTAYKLLTVELQRIANTIYLRGAK